MAIPIRPQTGTPIARAAARRPVLRPDLPPGYTPPHAPTDPYAGILAGLPKPLTGAQISAEAQGEISPLLAAVTKTISGQTAAAQHAISGFTGDAAAKLAQIDFGAPYSQGEQGQAAVDAALRQSLAGAGQSDADALAQRLGVINDPSVGAAASALAANGAANGTTQVAQGSASLGNLIANAAAAQSYGQKQPGIERLAGLQAIAAAGQQGQAQIAAQAEQLQAQLPSIIQNLEARNDARSQALTAARENQLARADAIGAAGATAAAKAAATNATNATRLTVAGIAAQTAREKAQAEAAQTSFSNRLRFAKTYGYDPVTGKTLPGYAKNGVGNVVKVSKPGAAKGQLTDSQAAKLVQQWHDGKPTSVTTEVKDPKTGKAAVNPTSGKPITETNTAVTGNLNYGQAYAMLRQFGKSDTDARGLLNTVYAKGDSGRAWVTNEEQAALQKAGVPYKAKLVKAADGSERGLLGPHQFQTLKKAGILPPGQLTAEGWFVIAPGH